MLLTHKSWHPTNSPQQCKMFWLSLSSLHSPGRLRLNLKHMFSVTLWKMSIKRCRVNENIFYKYFVVVLVPTIQRFTKVCCCVMRGSFFLVGAKKKKSNLLKFAKNFRLLSQSFQLITWYIHVAYTVYFRLKLGDVDDILKPGVGGIGRGREITLNTRHVGILVSGNCEISNIWNM